MRQQQSGKLISALFSVPGFTTQSCKVDFLHCWVTADWHGCLLFYIQQQKIAGVSTRVRCAKLFRDIQQFYKDNKVQDRLPKLLPTMLRREVKGKKKVPKLRVKAGESRALAPCCLQLATQYMDASIPHESAMLQGCKHLQAMYACLSAANWDADKFLRAAQKFLLLMRTLESFFGEDILFRVKPKGHLLLELARSRTNPAHTWTYRDESFGHTLALLARRRGGKFSMAAVSKATLLRFLAANKVPRLDM